MRDISSAMLELMVVNIAWAASSMEVFMLVGYFLYRFSRQFHIQRDLTAAEEVGRQIAQDYRRIGNSGFGAAFVIAGRARVSPGALRSHPEQSQRIEPGDTAAPGADTADIRHLDTDFIILKPSDRRSGPLRHF